MACPHLKEVVMLFCDTCPVRKMLPLDRIVTASPCLGEYQGCPLFQEVTARLVAARDAASGVHAAAPAER
jgi:hypothetical protein